MRENPSSLEALFELLGKLARKRRQLGERQFATIGLNHTEARMLTVLTRMGGEATQDALSNQIAVDRSNAGRALQKLESRGTIVRTTDATDRRTRFIRITDSGRQTVAEIDSLRSGMARTFFGNLSEDQAQLIVDLLLAASEDGAGGIE